MPHIAEDRLHAWLDRPRSGMAAVEAAEIERHLEDCPACGAEAAATGMLRGRAAAILATAGPADVAMPPIEALEARAGARPRPLRRAWVRTAWAASILAAAGLGWLSRDLFRPQQVAFEGAAESAEGAGSGGSAAPLTPTGARIDGDRAAEVGNDASREGAGPGPGDAAPSAATASAAARAVEVEDADASTGAGALETVVTAAAPPPVASAEAARSAADRALRATAPPPAWAAATRADAERRLGAPMATIPDLPIVRIELPLDSAQRVVRIVQRVASGAEVTLTQWPADEPPEPGLVAPPGAVGRRHGTLWIAADGPIAQDALESLLARVVSPDV